MRLCRDCRFRVGDWCDPLEKPTFSTAHKCRTYRLVELVCDIRWAAEQLAAGKPVVGEDGVMIWQGEGHVIEGRVGSPFQFTPVELLATNYELAEPEPAEIECKCGNCRYWKDMRRTFYHACQHQPGLCIHRESVACKDFEAMP